MIWFIFLDWDELYLWKLAAAMQTVAYVPLILKVVLTQNVSGISAGKLALDILALSLRSVATGWTGVILPREAGNDFIRAADGIALGVALLLLIAVRLIFRSSYKPEEDAFSITVPAIACMGLALVAHVDIGRAGFVVDTIYTASLYVEAIAMMPQLFLMGKTGKGDEVVGHHIVLWFICRMLGLMFWYLIKGHWMQGTSYSGWTIMAAYMGQLLLMSNFLCWYVQSLSQNALTFGAIECCPSPPKEESKEKES
jgi:uncharacterized protein with PQ loop repeat